MRRIPILIAACLMLAATGVAAQVHSVAMRGVLFDSATGQGLENVAIHVNQSLIPERSDSLGEFLLRGLGVGEYSLTVAKTGYRPQVFWLSVTAQQGDTIDIGGLPMAPTDEAITGAISGNVLDSRSNLPVAGSEIVLNGDIVSQSGDGGGFATGIVDVTPGLNVVEFRRLGYEPYESQIWAVQQHTDFEIDVVLDPLPIDIDTVVVEGDSVTFAVGSSQEFYQRRQTGVGHFVTRQDIDERRPRLVSDLLRMVPGIVVRRGASGGNRIEVFGPRSQTQACPSLSLFINGRYVASTSGEELDELVHPDDVAGLEVYPRPAQVPGRFKTTGRACGVIVVWTRRN